MASGFEKQNSVLIVSASERARESIAGVLLPSRYSPIAMRGSAAEARRLMLDTPFSLVFINTPLPAISDAIYNAIGTRFYELPITPEQIAMAVAKKE